MVERSINEGVADNTRAAQTEIKLIPTTGASEANFTVLPTFTVNDEDEIKYYNKDGVHIWGGIISNLKDDYGVKILKCEDYYGLLKKSRYNKFFIDKTLMEILQEITTDVGLTLVTTITAPTVIEKFDARNKRGNEIFEQIAQILGAEFYVDKDKKLNLELYGEYANPLNINTKNSSRVKPWENDKSKLANDINLEGDRQVFQKTQNFTAEARLDVTLSEIPIDVTLYAGGVELDGYVPGSGSGDYYVRKESKKIIFDSVQNDALEIIYTWNFPLNLNKKVVASFDKYGSYPGTVRKSYFTTINEAINYLNNYANIFSEPIRRSKWRVKNYNEFKNFYPNRTIFVDDDKKGISGTFRINEIKYVFGGSGTGLFITVGDLEDTIVDWQKETQERVKQLENVDNNTDRVNQAESFTNTTKLTYTSTIISNRKRGIGDCFYLSEDGAFANNQMKEDGLGPVMCEENSMPDWEGVTPSLFPLRLPFTLGA